MPDQLEVRIAGRVALAVPAGAVELEAVELDGEPLVGPKGVDLVGGLLSVNPEQKRYDRAGGGRLAARRPA